MSDTLSRVVFSSGKDDWGTPRDFFDTLHDEFHFTVDAAANEHNHLLPRWFGPGGLAPDAITASWRHECCWLNPPYSSVATFTAKAKAEMHHATTVMLIPSRTDTRYWHQYIWDASRHHWQDGVSGRFVKGRLRFTDDGVSRDAAPFPSVLVIFGA